MNYNPPVQKPRYTVDEIRQALEKGNGFYSRASVILGCTYQTVARYVKNHVELQEYLEDLTQARIDLAENGMLGHIEDAYFPALKFYLETKGKERGYTKRIEQAPVDPEATRPIVNVTIGTPKDS